MDGDWILPKGSQDKGEHMLTSLTNSIWRNLEEQCVGKVCRPLSLEQRISQKGVFR